MYSFFNPAKVSRRALGVVSPLFGPDEGGHRIKRTLKIEFLIPIFLPCPRTNCYPESLHDITTPMEIHKYSPSLLLLLHSSSASPTPASSLSPRRATVVWFPPLYFSTMLLSALLLRCQAYSSLSGPQWVHSVRTLTATLHPDAATRPLRRALWTLPSRPLPSSMFPLWGYRLYTPRTALPSA